MTAKQIAADPQLKAMADREVVLLTDGVDITYDFRWLDDLKAQYGIEEADPETALGLVIEAMNQPRPTVDTLSERADGTDLALAELGVNVADNEITSDGLQEAIAELGTLIGEING